MSEKVEKEIFWLNAHFFNEEEFLVIENNGENDIFRNVHSIKFFPGKNYVEINYLKHKRKNENFNENKNSNEKNLISNENSKNFNKNELITYIKKNRIEFYKTSPIFSFIDQKTYENFIEKITNLNIIRNINLTKQSNIGIDITEIEYLIEKNPFLKNIDPLLISPNMPKNFSEKTLKIFPNSLISILFSKITRNKKKINSFLFIGENGMGKTFSLFFIVFLLRLNPFNLIISIFNCEDFHSNFEKYLKLEIIYSLMFLYLNNENLNVNELFSLFYEKNFECVLNKIFEIIVKVFNVYNNDLNLFFFCGSN